MIIEKMKSNNYIEEKEEILNKEEKDVNLINKYVIESSFLYFFEEDLILNIYKHKKTILIILLILLSLFYYIPATKLNSNLQDIENYIKDNLQNKLYHSKSLFQKNDNPLISIVISTFNGEIYLKPVVRSIQNQDLLNLEIIIVDDASLDNSVKVVEELMKEDPRIILIKNGINRGTLYTKTRGVLNAKGKYVMTLDHDNLYAKENVFSMLYNESEKYNLDLLGFAALETPVDIRNSKNVLYHNYKNTNIIQKPIIQTLFLSVNYRSQSSTSLCMYFIKTELFLKVIKQLGDKFINRNIDAYDDAISMLLLSRNALTLKHSKEIVYIILNWPEEYSVPLTFQKTVKKRERERRNCYSYLTFAEILLLYTDNDKNDKRYTMNFIEWFLKNEKCKNQSDIFNDTLRVSNLFLNNEYINSKIKREISSYLEQIRRFI